MAMSCYIFLELIHYLTCRSHPVTSSARSARVTTIRLKSWTPTTRKTTRPEIRHHNLKGRKTGSTSASFAIGLMHRFIMFITTNGRCTDESRHPSNQGGSSKAPSRVTFVESFLQGSFMSFNTRDGCTKSAKNNLADLTIKHWGNFNFKNLSTLHHFSFGGFINEYIIGIFYF